ncbi:MAG: cytochrome b/b6 domain-containing protein [Candidatus Kapabacteria bacterium]|nr:cytochrome b/b6 domain-containing protein [Candidatus Kapabacteria bacterium]
MKKIEIYPVWIRLWHVVNGVLFALLLFSGIGLHFGLMTIHSALTLHIISGLALVAAYLVFFIANIFSGNIKNYFKKPNRLFYRLKKELKYYFWDIFLKQDLPYNPEKSKFGLVKQILHAKMMYFILPLIILSGLILLLPDLIDRDMIKDSEVWRISLIHTILAYIITIFFVIHIYLGTTGKTSGQMFAAITKGWILYDETSKVEEYEVAISRKGAKGFFPIAFYNPLTILGTILSLVSFTCIIIMMLFDFAIGFVNPYVGIITFIFLPSFMVGGLVLIFLGALWHHKKKNEIENPDKLLPIFDFNKPRVQKTFLFGSIIGIFLLLLSVVGSFQAFHYTESDEFCGEVCHKVMHPEYTAYKDSPHSRVGCVKCHIGSGADWFVKAKISGSWQLISSAFNLYSKPIPTPVEHLRPAQGTCEQCHWPAHFNSEKKAVFDFFQSDENNSETKLTMLLKTGGGTPESGSFSGIHYHMNIANEIHYLATDKKRQEIPYIHVVSRVTGDTTIYFDTDVKVTDDMIKPEKLRKMDCIDCHNRPAHIFNIPYKEINKYMSNDGIDKSLPYIKNLAVQILESYSINRENSHNEISGYINNFYKKYYPNIIKEKQLTLNKSIENINRIYLRNYFPEMKSNWKHYPHNIGHLYTNGCFRCHDGKHVSKTGKVVSHDCNVCHTIISQQSPNQTEITRGIDLPFAHPGGDNLNIEKRLCADCHGVTKSIRKLTGKK